MAEPTRKTYEHRAASLFDSVDVDQSGTIDRNEFEKLYATAKQEALEELAKEQFLEKKVKDTKRRVKMVGCVSAVLLVMLAVSVIANCVGMYVISDAMKDTEVEPDGRMLDRKTGAPVATAADGMLSEMILLPTLQDFDAYNKLDFVNFEQNGIIMGEQVIGWRWYTQALLVLSLSSGADLNIDRAANSTNLVKRVGTMYWDSTGTAKTIGKADPTTSTNAAAACAESDIQCPLELCEVQYATPTSFHSIQCKGLELWNYKDDLLLPAKAVAVSRRKMTAFHVANGIASFAAGFVGLSYPGQNGIANTLGQMGRFAFDHVQENGCHPASTIVFDATGNERRIDSVAIGDKIMGPSGPTTVVGFLHRDAAKKVRFLTLTTDNGALTLTKEHMLIVNGELKEAGAVRIGDVLNANGQPVAVKRVEEVVDTGAFHLFVEAPTYLARDAGSESKYEVSNLLLWNDGDWTLEKFTAMYERSKVCYAKGKPFDFTPEWWYSRKGISKHDALHCDGETTALPAP